MVRIAHIYWVWQLKLNKIERDVKFDPVELQKHDLALFVHDKQKIPNSTSVACNI